MLYNKYLTKIAKSSLGNKFVSLGVLILCFNFLFLALINTNIISSSKVSADHHTEIYPIHNVSGYTCDTTEWHFIINQLESAADAPAYITITFSNSTSLNVALTSTSGRNTVAAHYRINFALYPEYQNLQVTGGYAEIYTGWEGQFNTSHGPGSCGNQTTPTVTPTITVTVTTTPTLTITVTPTESVTVTPTPTEIVARDADPTATPTEDPQGAVVTDPIDPTASVYDPGVVAGGQVMPNTAAKRSSNIKTLVFAISSVVGVVFILIGKNREAVLVK